MRILRFLGLWISLSAASFSKTKQFLPPPELSLEAQSYAISTVLPLPHQLLQIPVGGSHFLQSPLPLTTTTASVMTTQTQRVPINASEKTPNTSSVRLLARSRDQFLLLDGTNLQTSLYSRDLHLISSHSIPYDKILPAADTGGEAPVWERKALQTKFLAAYARTPAEKLSGLAPLPPDWSKPSRQDQPGQQQSYLVASRIPGFPLLLLACSGANPSACHLDRACFVEGWNQDPAAVTGLALYPPLRLVLLGHHKSHTLTALRYHSCFHTQTLATYSLPPTLKTLASLAFDEEGNLWLSTLKPDDYKNANVFRWSQATLPFMAAPQSLPPAAPNKGR